MTEHGVLTPEGIVYSGGTRELATMPATLEDLMHAALDQKLTHLWIPPGLGLAFTRDQAQGLLAADMWDVGERGRFISVQKQGQWQGYIASVTGRRLQPFPTKNTRLIFVEQSNWPLDNAAPAELLRTAEKIESVLGVAMAGSPTSVGLRYLEKMNTRYYDAYFEKSDAVDWEALKGEHVPMMAWFPSVAVGRQQSYLHCFDRNSSHPYAASQENMGVGTPFVQEGGEFDKRYPGLWNVEISGGESISPALPLLFPNSRTWLPTSLLKVATMPAIGYTIKVNLAFLWPAGKPVFERWAKSLWAFREEYPDGSIERRSIKAIMNNVVGGLRVGEEMDSTLRPDWYATIVGAERAVVWYKAWKLAQASGVYPCGAYADALYYLSSERDPRAAAPDLLDHEHSLGGYKLAWTLPIDGAAQELLAQKMGAAARIGELKKLVRGMK